MVADAARTAPASKPVQPVLTACQVKGCVAPTIPAPQTSLPLSWLMTASKPSALAPLLMPTKGSSIPPPEPSSQQPALPDLPDTDAMSTGGSTEASLSHVTHTARACGLPEFEPMTSTNFIWGCHGLVRVHSIAGHSP